jgi:hypothetical protein
MALTTSEGCPQSVWLTATADSLTTKTMFLLPVDIVCNSTATNDTGVRSGVLSTGGRPVVVVQQQQQQGIDARSLQQNIDFNRQGCSMQ